MDDSQYSRLVRQASLLATIIAITLLVIKSAAYLLTGAVSILASQVDSLMDIGISVVNLLAIRYALRPPDAEHRFGHGKVEPLAGLLQAGFICGTAIILLYTGIAAVWTPKPLVQTSVGLLVMAISTVLTLLLIFYQLYTVRRTGNSVIKADSLHYSIDILMNLAVMVALVLDRIGWWWADGLFTIAIALYIFRGAWSIGFEAFQHLLDRELDDDFKDEIVATVEAVDGIQGTHDLRTRQSGQIIFIQIHIELDDNLPLIQAHAIAERVEQQLKSRWPKSDILIHQDPLSVIGKEPSLDFQTT
ncbi:cation diffusion facilitator family transporter [Celerinatantimonas sp. YJH-8]|uniref:cation diffusion facilitator family transporter n=1 Tax=Celerinatantimonas sp. YJH-8 TaxID=3228714 RepID=UPI0038BEE9D5